MGQKHAKGGLLNFEKWQFDAEWDAKAQLPVLKPKALPGLHGVHTMKLFSSAFCKRIADEFWSSTTQTERILEGISMPNAFFRFGDRVASLLDGMLPALRADASEFGAREDEVRIWRDEHRRLRFVEGVLVYYDKLNHPKIQWHTDAHDLTLNVNLGRAGFTGGDLQFSCLPDDLLYHGYFETLCNCNGKALRQTPHVQKQIPGLGVVNLGCVPHSTKPVQSGERLNLIFRFILVPNDEHPGVLSKKRQFQSWTKLFAPVQRKVLTFLSSSDLAFMAQTCKAMSAACRDNALWQALYASNDTLTGFVSVDDLRTGAHLKSSESDMPLALLRDEQQLRRRVVLKDGNWFDAYRLAARFSFSAEQQQRSRRRRPRPRMRTGVYLRNRDTDDWHLAS